MYLILPLTIYFLGALLLPAGALAQVVINEVLFDPVGSDTGLEWVEIYNASENPVDLSGWQLYPDGIGYYTFHAGFTIPSHGFVAVNLRVSGTDSATELFHSAASANMGNSSGSLGLFSGEPRSAETIKSFMRYHKPGSSERKTWESTAVEQGLWQAGAFIDISNVAEGSSVGLAQNGITAGFPQAWKVYLSPTKISSNNGETGTTTDDGGGAANPAPINTVPHYVVPRLEVDITTSANGIIGAPHRFQGSAFGRENKKIEGDVRYLWNFSDGSVAEGPGISHTFRFPGTYTVSLDVTSASGAVGSTIREVAVLANTIFVSEVLPGPRGFVEIENTGSDMIDLGGWILRDAPDHYFTLPASTKIRGAGLAVFPNDVIQLLLASSTGLILQYANMSTADAVGLLDYTGGRSTARLADGHWSLANPTPGTKATAGAVVLGSVSQPAKVSLSSSPPAEAVRAEDPPAEVTLEEAPDPIGSGTPEMLAAAGIPVESMNLGYVLFLGAMLLGIGAAVFIVVSKPR